MSEKIKETARRSSNTMKICFIRHPKLIHARRWIEYFAARGHEMHILYFEGDFDTGPEVDKYFPELSQFENVYIHCVRSDPNKIKIIKLIRNMLGNKAKDGLIYSSQEEKETKSYIRRIRYLVVNIGKFPYAIMNTIIKVRSLRKIIRQINPDIIHALSLDYYGWFAALSGFYPFVATPLGSDISWNPEQSKLAKWKTKFVLKKADIVHVSDEAAKSRVTEIGCKRDKIFVQPFGVDTKEFSPSRRSLELREKLSEGNSTIISIRKLISYYDVKTLIFAIPKVLEKFSEAKFIIIGDGEQMEELTRFAKELEVFKAVRFVDYMPHERMPIYLASSDIYVDTYCEVYQKAGGGIGVGLMEAMSCGLAPVVSKKPFDFVIKDGINGVHFQGGNADDLAEKIIFLLENAGKREEFGSKNREIALKIGDWRTNMEIFEKEIYLKLEK